MSGYIKSMRILAMNMLVSNIDVVILKSQDEEFRAECKELQSEMGIKECVTLRIPTGEKLRIRRLA